MRTTVCTILFALASTPAAALTFTVTRGDDPVPAPACAPGDCTLRAAILAVNGNGGADTIAFNIPPSAPGAVVTITPSALLPAITGDATTIDGFTQPGAAAGSPSTIRFTSIIKVHLKGNPTNLAVPDGLELNADNSLITGLAISHFPDRQAHVRGAGNTVSGSLLGIAPDTDFGQPFGEIGLRIGTGDGSDSIFNNTIGTAARPNVIAAVVVGIDVGAVGAGTTPAEENRAQSNLIGVGADGFGVFPLTTGIRLRNATNFRIGENSPPGGTRGNIIGGGGIQSIGIDILGGSRVAVRGNTVGGAPSAERVFHPLDTGILLDGPATDIEITFNSLYGTRGNGIEIVGGAASPQDVFITQNRVFASGGLPIDLGGNGTTPNDAGDTDAGPNTLLNFPQLTYNFDGTNVTVNGTLDTTPNGSFLIDLVGVPHPAITRPVAGPITNALEFLFTDPPTVLTDATGRANFTAQFPDFELARGFVPGAVAIAATTFATSEASGGTVNLNDLPIPSGVTFHTWYESNVKPTVAREVLVLRTGRTDIAVSATVRSQGPGTTIPAIPSGGLVLTWPAGDTAPKGITLVYNGSPLARLTSWALTLSNPVNTALYPYPSYVLLIKGPYEPWDAIDEIFGRPSGAGSMEFPGRNL